MKIQCAKWLTQRRALAGETHAYSLEEITQMLNALPTPAATINVAINRTCKTCNLPVAGMCFRFDSNPRLQSVFRLRNLRTPGKTGCPWIGSFISPAYASIFAQNARSMSAYSGIRQECFRIELFDSGVATEPRKFLSPSGKGSTRKKHRHED